MEEEESREVSEIDPSLQSSPQKFVELIGAFWLRFLLCQINNTRKTQKKVIIAHNLMANLKKKKADFNNKIIPMVLRGNTSLLDLSLLDSANTFSYSLRADLPDSVIFTPSLFHRSKIDGEFDPDTTNEDARLLFSGLDFKTPSLSAMPFLRIYSTKVQNTQGNIEAIPAWFNNKSFIQILHDNIAEAAKDVDVLINRLRHMLFRCTRPLIGEKSQDETYGVWDNAEEFVCIKDNVLMEYETNDSGNLIFKFSFYNFLFQYDKKMVLKVGTVNPKWEEQPPLSVKCQFIKSQIRQLLDELVSINTVAIFTHTNMTSTIFLHINHFCF